MERKRVPPCNTFNFYKPLVGPNRSGFTTESLPFTEVIKHESAIAFALFWNFNAKSVVNTTHDLIYE